MPAAAGPTRRAPGPPTVPDAEVAEHEATAGRRIDLRLLPAALTAWAFGLAVTMAPDASWPIAGISGACALAVLGGLWVVRRYGTTRRRRVGGLVSSVAAQAAWCLALAALVAVSGGAQWQAARGPAVEAALEFRGPLVVRAVVTGLIPDDAVVASTSSDGTGSGASSPSTWSEGGPMTGRFDARATAVLLHGHWHEVDVSLLVFGTVTAVADEARAPAIGAGLELEARLRAADGGDATLMAHATGPARVVGPAHPLLSWADELRFRFTAAARELPSAGGQLLPGLAVGDTRAVEADLETDMKTSSLTHLTAVSGANCALVVGAIVLLGRVLGWRRGVRIAAAGTALAGFVVLVTPEGSVIRAATMAAIVLVADGWGRHVRGAPVLCLAVIALLIASPSLATDYGFALSVAATSGLLLGTRPLAARLERWLPRWLAMGLAVPIAAQLACQPILILLSPTIPVHGVVANLLAAPAAPVATMVGLVGAILATVAPPLAPAALWVAWLPAQWIGVIAHGVADWPFATLPWPGELGGAILLGGLTAVAAAAWLTRPRRRAARRLRWLAGVVVVAVIAVLVGSALGSTLLRSATFPADWRYAACDVGQGDAIVVRAGERIALIDTGPEPEPLVACLDLLGITRIDLLVLSHFDHDHDGAAGAIADRVAAVLVPATLEAVAEPLVGHLLNRGVPVHPASAGDTWLLGDTVWRAVWPPATANGGPSPLSGNEGSLAVHVVPTSGAGNPLTGGFTARGPTLLSLGDLGEAAQDEVLAATPELVMADVVKMSHHGSSDQSPALYAATGARLGLVSAGIDNGYGHPTGEALAMLAAAGIEAARTDLHGTIVVSGEPDAPLTIWRAGRPVIESGGTTEHAALGGAAQQPTSRRHAHARSQPERRLGTARRCCAALHVIRVPWRTHGTREGACHVQC